MSKKQKRIFWLAVLVILATSAVLGSRALRTPVNSAAKEPDASAASETNSKSQPMAMPAGTRPAPRNLSMQPEALKISRKLGQRFLSSRREVSVMMGTLTIGTERQHIQVYRRQNDHGERVQIVIGNGSVALSWSETEGSRASNRAASESERVLIERLALDSVDQFVLAQLRGASYYTVARNVMPAEAGGADDYRGPVWDIVRVDDPETDAQKQPFSKWRLYYLNTQTGLIDKVISEVHGERIETNFADWTDEGGEKFPTRITWTRLGQPIMEFKLNNFAHHSQQQ
jgi:hypothetical protein